MSRSIIAIAAFAVGLLAGGCGKDDGAAAGKSEVRKAGAPAGAAAKPAKNTPPAKVEVKADDDPTMAEAKRIFLMRCAQCHGETGKGDGAAASALNPKPRDYTDAAWQKTVTDEEIRTAIVKGGVAVGKSQLMPAQPDLESKPELVDGLVALIRSFAK
ncbi:MAG: cytochrome c [Myxococcota bacterium]